MAETEKYRKITMFFEENGILFFAFPPCPPFAFFLRFFSHRSLHFRFSFFVPRLRGIAPSYGVHSETEFSSIAKGVCWNGHG